MWDRSFYQSSAHLGAQFPQPPHSRHGILLAAYKAERHKRLVLERMAARTANRSIRRKFAALLRTLAAAMVVGTRRLMPAGYGVSRSGSERTSELVAGE